MTNRSRKETDPIIRAGRILTATLVASANLHAAPPWGTPQMQPGIALVTCVAPDTDASSNPVPASAAYVCGLLDLRNPSAPLYGPNGMAAPLWNPPMHHEASWTADNLGMLYGTAIDADGDMYVAAGGLYPASYIGNFYRHYGNLGGGPTSTAAAGTIYRLDRLSGAPSVFTVLPQQATNLGAGFISGPGVGNIAYDAGFDQFFATNLEDGMIYRIASTGGPPVAAYDPLGPDDGAPGMPPTRERLWGIAVHDGQVYYAVWNTGDTVDPGKIRRVDLDASGAIVPATDVEILTVPGSSTMASDWNTVLAPVGDIEISTDGRTMILGQRTQRDWGGYVATANHAGKVFIARLSGTSWAVTNTLETGNSWGHGETYGGVALGMENGVEEQVVWATSADLATGAGPHGLQGTRPADFPVVSSIVPLCYKVPYDPAYTTAGPDYKGIGGDVEIMRDRPCVSVAVEDVRCPPEPGADFTVSLGLTNQSGATVQYLWLTPCPTAELPAGAITAQPAPSSIITLSSPVPDGASFHQTIQLPGTAGGQTVCFRVTLLDETGKECCTEKVCIELPPCDCLEVLDETIKCELTDNGLVKYTITLTVRNRTNFSANPFDFAHATFLPPSGFSPANVAPTPNPIPPGGIGQIETCYFGLPGPLSFTLSVHDPTLEYCCSIEDYFLTLPDCPPGAGEPDFCKLERRVPCHRDADGGIPQATANFTICNQSTMPRTYNWSVSALADPNCNLLLPASAFAPASGTVGPVPPGGCVTVPITIACEDFRPGDCAAFQVCVSFDPAVEPLCCRGEVYRPAEGEALVTSGDETGALAIAPRETKSLTLVLDNPGPEALELVLVLMDEIGILSYLGDDGVPRAPSNLPVSIPAGGSVPLTLEMIREDDGHRAPPYTSILVFAEGGSPHRPLLDVPVRLLAPANRESSFAVRSFSISAEPKPSVTLVVATTAGRRYLVQESLDLVRWSNSECSPLDTNVNPDGTFDGTGENVTCVVPCADGDLRRFYRVVENQ